MQDHCIHRLGGITALQHMPSGFMVGRQWITLQNIDRNPEFHLPCISHLGFCSTTRPSKRASVGDLLISSSAQEKCGRMCLLQYSYLLSPRENIPSVFQKRSFHALIRATLSHPSHYTADRAQQILPPRAFDIFQGLQVTAQRDILLYLVENLSELFSDGLKYLLAACEEINSLNPLPYAQNKAFGGGSQIHSHLALWQNYLSIGHDDA